ncbi:MAG: hypothetical protein ACOC9R_01490 [bacterium]
MTKPWGFVVGDRVVTADVLEGYALKQASLQLPTQQTFEGEVGLLAPRYDPAQLAGLLEINTPHLVATRQKAEDIIGRGWAMERTSDDADTADRDRVQQWFDEIPPPTSALDSHSNRDVLTAAQFDFESLGRGAFELVREDKDPRAPVAMMVHVPAYTLRLHRDEVRFVQSRGGKRRWFKWAGADVDVDFDSGRVFGLGELPARRRANEIVWWRNYHPRDPIYGMPDVIPAIGAIHGDIGRRDYNIDFFANYGIPSYAIFVTGDFDPGDMVDKNGDVVPDDDSSAVMTEAEYRMHQLLKQVRANPHSSLVFTIPTRDQEGEVKVEFKPLATEVKEASFRLYRRDNREEVLSSHRMSAAIAGVYDAGAANREAREQYIQSLVIPRRTTLETVINHYVVAPMRAPGWRWRLLPGRRESEHRLDMLVRLHGVEAVTSQEVRGRFAGELGLPEQMPDDPRPATDDVETALRSLRDDLVTAALKYQGNGGHPLLGALR